jgi:cystathionine beta-lyase/cystathionine gamma-synthase
MEALRLVLLLLLEWPQSIQLWLHYYNQAIISFRQAVFWGNPFIVCELFPKWNIETTYFDINNPDIIESCIKPNTKILLPNHLLTQRLIL